MCFYLIQSLHCESNDGNVCCCGFSLDCVGFQEHKIIFFNYLVPATGFFGNVELVFKIFSLPDTSTAS